jgi:hypothetical protein
LYLAMTRKQTVGEFRAESHGRVDNKLCAARDFTLRPQVPLTLDSAVSRYSGHRSSAFPTQSSASRVTARLVVISVLGILGVVLDACSGQPAAPEFKQILALKPEEGVFAYARISPDGRSLVYATEGSGTARTGGPFPTINVRDITNGSLLFSEPGVDGYWSPDGRRIIYESFLDGHPRVNIRDIRGGTVSRDVVPVDAGDYYSWGEQDGRNIVATIKGFYFALSHGKAGPLARIRPCDGIGIGERPLLSHDGVRVTTFVRGTIVVRNLSDCVDIFDTGIQGAKADFSWDGRYIAFHAPKIRGSGYDIYVIDLALRTIRVITHMLGSSFYPNWTKDGRLCFRYDGSDYRGFVIASNVLSAPPSPLPAVTSRVPRRPLWSEIFPETDWPDHPVDVVAVWGTWSAHSAFALSQLQLAREELSKRGVDIGTFAAVDPGSSPKDVAMLLARHGISLPQVPLDPLRLPLTEGQNQIPAILLFRNRRLLDRRLGAQSAESLEEWILTSRGNGH